MNLPSYLNRDHQALGAYIIPRPQTTSSLSSSSAQLKLSNLFMLLIFWHQYLTPASLISLLFFSSIKFPILETGKWLRAKHKESNFLNLNFSYLCDPAKLFNPQCLSYFFHKMGLAVLPSRTSVSLKPGFSKEKQTFGPKDTLSF